tara:strand:+ start:457 stop:963 length:507 start_codon:yes stop_codon:yes gene_type:complete
VAKRVKRNYVNNPDFLEGLIQYRAACADSRHKGVQLPVVPNYIGACIQSIAYRLATKPNFSGYTFKEDMIMDGIENCLRYIENFDPDKSSNPFAYFTQIIWYAFLRRIAKEKKHLYTKLKSSQSMIALGETYAGGSEVVMNINIDASYIDSFIEDYEAKLDKDKEKAK